MCFFWSAQSGVRVSTTMDKVNELIYPETCSLSIISSLLSTSIDLIAILLFSPGFEHLKWTFILVWFISWSINCSWEKTVGIWGPDKIPENLGQQKTWMHHTQFITRVEHVGRLHILTYGLNCRKNKLLLELCVFTVNLIYPAFLLEEESNEISLPLGPWIFNIFLFKKKSKIRVNMVRVWIILRKKTERIF